MTIVYAGLALCLGGCVAAHFINPFNSPEWLYILVGGSVVGGGLIAIVGYAVVRLA